MQSTPLLAAAYSTVWPAKEIQPYGAEGEKNDSMCL